MPLHKKKGILRGIVVVVINIINVIVVVTFSLL